MSHPTCHTCRYHDWHDVSCRRYPPKFIEGDFQNSHFPTVKSSDWCGEYKLLSPLVTENNT
jgi:hypothetical protein